jgi:hypothetical protein
MAALNFTVAYATTLEAVQSLTPNTTVYADDLGNCSSCVSETGSCWACLVEEVGPGSGLRRGVEALLPPRPGPLPHLVLRTPP